MAQKTEASLTAAIVGVGQAKGDGSPTGGAWRIGYMHARMYAHTPGIELVTAADINATNLQVFQEKFSVADGYESLEKMLAVTTPDIVSICTYVGLHLEMIKSCVAAGVKAIICEKPFLNSPAELAELRATVKTTGIKIIVPHFRRYLPAFARARDIYMSGEVGTPVVVTAAIGDNWDLSEWGSHWLDMFRFFHGDEMPKWVMGQARVRDRRGFGHAMEDHALAFMEFPNNGRALLEVGENYLNDDVTMVLTGSRGSVSVIGEDKLRISSPDGYREEDLSAPDAGLNSWSEMAADLRDWVNGGPEAPLGFDHIAGTSELNLGAYISMCDGDRVEFPLKHTGDEWPVEELARRASKK